MDVAPHRFSLYFCSIAVKKPSLLQRVEQACIDIVADFLADIGKLLEDVLRARDRGFEILRRLRLEVVVGDVEDFRIADLQLLRQYFLGALLVGERDVIALDARLEKAREQIAARARYRRGARRCR